MPEIGNTHEKMLRILLIYNGSPHLHIRMFIYILLYIFLGHADILSTKKEAIDAQRADCYNLRTDRQI